MTYKQERLVFIPKDEDENRMSLALKRLATQDETTHHDLLKEAIQLLFVKHNLDLGGNPQRQLFSFTQQQIVKPEKCGFKDCGKIAVGVGLFKPKNQTFGLCAEHFSSARENPHIWTDLKFPKEQQKEIL
jgi:hypothetical protein